MSAFYYLELIEAKKNDNIVRWFYEGKDYFSKEGVDGLIKGDDVIKELWDLINEGYIATVTSKEGKITKFTSTKDLLIYCFQDIK